MMSDSLSGAVALITGADSGLGRAIAAELYRRGAQLILSIRDNASGKAELYPEIPCAHKRIISADLSNVVEIEHMVAAAHQVHGRLDVVVNNAGVRFAKRTVETEPTEWERVINVNARAPFFVCKEASRYMIQGSRGGSIINISSQLGVVAARDMSLYCISKAALIALTKSFALDLAQHRISVNCVAPGTTNTMEAGLMKTAEEVYDFVARSPLGRRIEMSEVAQAVAYLAESKGAVTGHTLVVDGGWTLS